MASATPMFTRRWHRYSSFKDASDATGKRACVYVQADRRGNPLRVGLATKGLSTRYYGGTGWAVQAAGHRSRNLWFVALVGEPKQCLPVEGNLLCTGGASS